MMIIIIIIIITTTTTAAFIPHAHSSSISTQPTDIRSNGNAIIDVT